ncbi:hypothetical protein MKW92_038510 [Papaver armeniacum]|nr:hypothetical protein MKW92_038510 [Papaver armeniacum]
MSTSGGYDHLLNIQPTELNFPFELKKRSSCCLQLTNKTDEYVAFKVKTTDRKKCCSCPNIGIVSPRKTCEVTITMEAPQAQEEMHCKDKLLIQSVTVAQTTLKEDLTREMFNKESVEEFKLRVIYYVPAKYPILLVPDQGSGSGNQGGGSCLLI